MYKDKDKQKEANRLAAKKYRDSMTGKGMMVKADVIPKADIHVIPERTAQGNIKVSKPGDTDYEPQCETTRAFIEGRDKRPETAKRGKDIKTFADLPPDVQQTIDTLSDDQTEHKRRTAIAINYQHQFPDRYHSTGCDVFKRRQGKTGVI